jgi:UDP-N-acetyl-D-galactosamine dehydrogenase
MLDINDVKLGVIGLGYVGLPLAVEFSRCYNIVAYDTDEARIEELRQGIDRTGEVPQLAAGQMRKLGFTANKEDLARCNVYIIAVPTPVNEDKSPDLSCLVSASKLVGEYLGKGDVVIYESTVYPGATEEVCVPALEQQSGLEYNTDFFVGYSPERINPGDSDRKLTTITKITSGSTPDAADFVDFLYSRIITAGTYKASSIQVAEAAKVIENTQRDVNIALVNEFAILFNKLGLDTLEVLEAAGTKWNFLPFRPGLVGGHCIGVDPYYLTYKAYKIGYEPRIILAGRQINDNMGSYVVEQLAAAMQGRGMTLDGARILLMGITFKENCPDVRNSLVMDINRKLQQNGAVVDVYDPIADSKQLKDTYNIESIDKPMNGLYDAVIVSVGHDHFRKMGADAVRKLGNDKSIVFDLKGLFPKDSMDMRL